MSFKLPKRVKLVEVGPRDGLQNESRILPTETKVQLIDYLSATGLDYIEIGAFVHPQWVPQLADTDQVAQRIQRQPGVMYSALVPNMKGLERALQAEMAEIAVFMSVTESHNLKNTNRSTAQALQDYQEVIQEARSNYLCVRAYLSTVFGCPYEGAVRPEQVIPLVEQLLDMGVYQVSLGDTIGVANPLGVQRLLALLQEKVPVSSLALHLHDTRGTALANVFAGLQMGVSVFDSAIGGLGGCPYAPGASGNLATEDLAYMLHEMGLGSGINLDALVTVNQWLQQVLNKPLPSKYAQACLATV